MSNNLQDRLNDDGVGVDGFDDGVFVFIFSTNHPKKTNTNHDNQSARARVRRTADGGRWRPREARLKMGLVGFQGRKWV